MLRRTVLALVAAVAPALRGVLMRESLVAPFTHSDSYGARVASPHWYQSKRARVLEHFVRLTGADSRAGELWSREPLDEAAVSAELTLRVSGDGAAPVAPAAAAGLGLWFADAPEAAPSTEAAFAAPPHVEDETDAPPPPLAAVGVVFFADGARVVARSAAGDVSVLGSCRAVLRGDASRPGYDVVLEARTVRLELVAGRAEANETTGVVETTPGYARLTIVKAPRPGRRRAATLCDARVVVDPLRDAAWLRRTRVGLVAAAPAPDPEDAPGEAPPAPDRQDVLGLLLRRQPVRENDADERPGAPRLRPHRRPRTEGPTSERCDALENGVDAALHRVEDVETAYEHELVTVRDDLRRTLSSLLQARRRSARRLAALEERATTEAWGTAAARLDRLEETLARASDKKYESLAGKVGVAARRHARARVDARWRGWRFAFVVPVAFGGLVAWRLRSFYRRLVRVHML